MTQSELIQFFAERPSINLKSFATECGLSQSLLWMIVNDKRTLQPNQIDLILPVAIRYGYKSIWSFKQYKDGRLEIEQVEWNDKIHTDKPLPKMTLPYYGHKFGED